MRCSEVELEVQIDLAAALFALSAPEELSSARQAIVARTGLSDLPHSADAAGVYDAFQCKRLTPILQLCRCEKALNANTFGDVDCRTRFLMDKAQADQFDAEKDDDHRNARNASNMLRHDDNIRLTEREKTTLDTVAGYRKDAPKTVDEHNGRLDAAAQLWEAGGSPEERLAAALAVDMKLEPTSRPVPTEQALAMAPDSDS
jgi:hypothetical protein